MPMLLVESFSDAIGAMHEGALPKIGYHGRIVEYPQSIASAIVGFDIDDILSTFRVTTLLNQVSD